MYQLGVLVTVWAREFLDKLLKFNLGGFKVSEDGIAVFELRVDNQCNEGNGGGSFKVEHWLDAAEVTNVHEAGVREV